MNERLIMIGLILIAYVNLGAVRQQIVVRIVLSCIVLPCVTKPAAPRRSTWLVFRKFVGSQEAKIVVLARLARVYFCVAVHLLDPTHDLNFGCGSERVARALQQESKVLRDITPTEIDPPCRVLD